MLAVLFLFASFGLLACVDPVSSSMASQFGLRFQSSPVQLPRGQSNDTAEGHLMSPSLKEFSNLNEDLVFEDSADVRTSHYGEDQEASASVVAPAATAEGGEEGALWPQSIRVQVDHGADSFSTLERVPLPPQSRASSQLPLTEQLTAHYRKVGARIRRFDALSPHFTGGLDAPKSTLDQLVSNHLGLGSITDLAPRGRPEPKVNRDILPKRTDLSRLDVIGPSALRDNSIEGGRVVSNGSKSNEEHSFDGDHILRPFTRKERRQQAFFGKPIRHKPATARDPSDWSVPVIELKRLTDPSSTNSPETAFFKKRLPLLSNEEGFVLPRPNSSLQRRDASAERRTDSVQSISPLNPEFKRRFGDLSLEPNPNHRPGGEATHHSPGQGNNFVPNDPFRLGYLMDDISLNDLDLDDIGPSRASNGQPSTPKNFANQGRKPLRGKSSNGPFEQPSPNENIPGQPISQLMPLFFDKFLSEFGNTNAQLSPEGFSLPPNQGKFGHFEHGHGPMGGNPNANQHLLPPMNQMEGDLSDLDAPNQVERRLVNGNGPLHKGKPDIGPPLFSNDIHPPPEFDNELGPWPKIFRFTDGRINLHDFEREKKRSRVKFSQKMSKSKSQALYNIKRESFLILHGGTFSQ